MALKVLHLAHFYAPHIGGVEKHLQRLNQELTLRGVQTTVITVHDDKSLPRSDQLASTRIFRIPVSEDTSSLVKKLKYKMEIWISLWKLREEIVQADVIQVHDVFFWLIPFLLLIPKKKIFITFHGYEGVDAPTWKQKFWHRLAAKLTQANMCIGAFHYFWYGIKPTQVSYGAADAVTIPNKRQANSIIYFGRLSQDTGFEEYLKAFALLPQKKYSLDVYAIGEERIAAEEYVESHKLAVRFFDPVPDVSDLLSKYEFAFVSRYLSMLEALQAGCRVIAQYNNQIKHDYLELSPLSSQIEIVTTPTKIADAVTLVKKVKTSDWIKKQTWAALADQYLELWQQTHSCALIVQTFGFGGAEVFLTDLMTYLSTKWQVKTYSNNKRLLNLLAQNSQDKQQIPVAIDIIGDWKGLIKAVFLTPFAIIYYGWLVFRTSKQTTILLTGFPEKIIVSWWAQVWKRKIVWIEFGPLETIFKKFAGMPHWLYQTAVKFPQKVIVPSENTKQHLIKTTGIAKEKYQLIPCARILNNLPAIGNPAVPTLVCVSRLEPGKGQDLLIRALAIIKKKIPNIKLKIVGQGGFDVELIKLATELSVTDNLTLTDWVSDSLTEMASASVCVFPSVWPLEGFGLVAIEAMALGKPVVAFNRGPSNELIQHNQNGLLAKEGDVNDLAKQIINVLSDKELANRLGKAAQKSYYQKYTFEAQGEAYLAALS